MEWKTVGPRKSTLFTALFTALLFITTIESGTVDSVVGETCTTDPGESNPVFCRNRQRNVCDFDRDAPGPDWDFFLYRNCFCDELCVAYGDCCADHRLNTSHPSHLTPLPTDTFQCAPVDGIYSYELGIYSVMKCPASWTDSEVRDLCETDRTDDVFLRWPVSGAHSGMLYKNVFCSRCHGEDDVKFWISNFTCTHARPDSLDATDLVSVISGMLNTGECFINFSHPTQKTGYRLCKPNVDVCPETFEDRCIRDLCEGSDSVTSYVYYNKQTIYKNSDCALCNSKTELLKCYDKVSKFSPLLITGQLPPYKYYPLCLVLDLNTGNGHMYEYEVGQVSGPPITETKTEIRTCANHYVYDPYMGDCRAISCRPGTVMQGNSCEGDCARVRLNHDEYKLFNNGTIYVIPFLKMYDADEYIKDGDTILVCTDLEQNYTLNVTIIRHDTVFKFSETQAIVSLIGQIISVLALFIHFVVYSILPQMRNLPGKNLMCLVFALFWAQLLFMSGGSAVENPPLCGALGALTHYFFLAAFCWMSVMSFDIWRTFTSKYGHQDINGAAKLFVRYSLFAWISPFCVVLLSLILDFVPISVLFRPGYGRGVCWINSRIALFLLFALPLAVMLLVNTVLYILTVLSIYRVSQATKMIKRSSDDKRRLFLYAKLCTIMGLTWIFGFIVASTDSSFTWYIFIIFNTLQGLFICLAFVCTSKVIRLLRDRFQKTKRGLARSAETSSTKQTSLSTSAQQSMTSRKASAPEIEHVVKPLLGGSKESEMKV